MRPGAGRPHPRSRPRRGVVEARRRPWMRAPLPGGGAEVPAWRERTAAATNRPRRMVLSDLGLTALSQRPPHNADELAARGIDGQHLAQGRAAEILQAVKRGLALPPDQVRLPSEGRDTPTRRGGRRVLGVVRQIADDLDFDQSLLATRANIAQLLCGEPSRLDTGWRRAIVGDPLRRLIAGEVAAAFVRRGHLVMEEPPGGPCHRPRTDRLGRADRPPSRAGAACTSAACPLPSDPASRAAPHWSAP